MNQQRVTQPDYVLLPGQHILPNHTSLVRIGQFSINASETSLVLVYFSPLYSSLIFDMYTGPQYNTDHYHRYQYNTGMPCLLVP